MEMEPEDVDVDIERITGNRRKAIERNIHVISTEDLKSLGEKLFPFLDHPWREVFFQLLEENSGSTFCHAATDRFEVIYCTAKEKGMWFTPSRAMGPMQPRQIEIMNEIVGKR